MNFSIDKESLISCLNNVYGAVEKRDSVPILLHVKFDVNADSTINLTTTNLDMEAIDSVIATSVSQSGSFTVPFSTLNDIVKKLPDANVNFSLVQSDSGARLEIKGKSCDFNIGSMPASDFPVMSKISPDHTIEINSKMLLSAFKGTVFCSSTDEYRHNLCGLLMHTSTDGKIYFVATDGHRLAVNKIQTEYKETLQNTIVPRKAILEMMKILQGKDEAVMIEISKKRISFNIGKMKFSSKIIDADFPDYTKVIPVANPNKIKFNLKGLISSVDRVSVMSNNSSLKGVKLSIDHGKVAINADSDNGRASEIIDIEYSGDKINVGFNFRYLLEILSHIENSELTQFDFKDELSPVLITSGGSMDQQFFVLMPMRL
jgi:DNA polymerase-3 subunit beta